jgi:hypothetical protein
VLALDLTMENLVHNVVEARCLTAPFLSDANDSVLHVNTPSALQVIQLH